MSAPWIDRVKHAMRNQPRKVEPDQPVPDDAASAYNVPRIVRPDQPVPDDVGSERDHLAPFSSTHFPFKPAPTFAQRALGKKRRR